MTQDNSWLAHEFVTMVNERNANAVDKLLVEDYIDHNVLIAPGREGNRAFWVDFFNAFPDITAKAEDVIVAGDRVVGRYSYHGHHLGPFMGMPPTGREIRMHTIDIWRIEDGRFAEHWDEINLYELLQQLGALPEAGAAAPHGGTEAAA
ncbi:ester cyclase [Streptomyces sp. DG2A-72]|uniref:ester cyclase n=1 Tax=Streptomyces sp. DG2A-72 TaxID=3051386 RepID=UPI00265C3B01|nr:ester cyclase [Streptomyces sp. DG2A-72]MDO0937281.1 ester cyclase [Streptomyces sp. DG2A-72]